jgi:hypothetical protein
MLVFIDESGDAGLKVDLGSSDYFVVTLLMFEENNEAELADLRIQNFKAETGKPTNFEFHFNKCSCRLRESFMAKICHCDFLYFSIVFNKRKLTGDGFKYKESFYKYACRLVFENAKAHLNNATVVIDGSGSREFRRELTTYLRKRINDVKSENRYIGKIKIQDSKNNNLLQLADMICGAIARSYTEKEDRETYRNYVKHREISVQFWPK